MRTPWIRTVAIRGGVLALLGLVSFAYASFDVDVHVDRCDVRFDRAMRVADGDTEAGRARLATALLREAYEALEPAYPPVRSVDGFRDPNAAWLRARDVIPASWTEERLDVDAWQTALARLQRPYGVEPLAITGVDSAGKIRADVEAALAAGASQLRPLALLGIEPSVDGEGEQIDFATVIWNWTPRPRLLVFDAAGEPLPDGGAVTGVLTEVGTCAWTPRYWIRAPADVARRFYFGNADTEVQILARPIGPFLGEIDVAHDDVEAAFRLDHPELTGQPYAAFGIAGPGPGFGTMLSIAASVRSNIGLFDFGRYLAFP